MQLRNAVIDDAEFILEIRNDESTRRNSFSKEEISFENHIKWYKKKLSDPDCFLYILEDGEKRIGNIRVDMNGDKGKVGEISYMIAPAFRGQGYGSVILGLLEQQMKEKVKVLIGFVLSENKASMKCFENNGYLKMPTGPVTCYLKIMD
ncbi:GNAT family N-acetyltransferase [Butyrivibrio sp. YAB3001]|uniref:GNAT family N-acetyltransferase n=1 Tax=Butyrivibrio sp. YAB3001 TaxID=1520812 RepID=UPI0008F63986|nr:GNAT family N-acetyltransferase [Butyrivibrio sp. YAB3001]SFC17087.1 L-amino acid N-acyltransferase YncA [Butyrivibrio sp. YAB3001]